MSNNNSRSNTKNQPGKKTFSATAVTSQRFGSRLSPRPLSPYSSSDSSSVCGGTGSISRRSASMIHSAQEAEVFEHITSATGVVIANSSRKQKSKVHPTSTLQQHTALASRLRSSVSNQQTHLSNASRRLDNAQSTPAEHVGTLSAVASVGSPPAKTATTEQQQLALQEDAAARADATSPVQQIMSAVEDQVDRAFTSAARATSPIVSQADEFFRRAAAAAAATTPAELEQVRRSAEAAWKDASDQAQAMLGAAMRSFSPAIDQDEYEDDYDEDENGETTPEGTEYDAATSAGSAYSKTLEFKKNDNTFYVVASNMVDFLQSKVTTIKPTAAARRHRVLVLHPHDRYLIERLLPETARRPFLEAVQYRLARTPSAPTSPLQLITLQCQELGLDRSDASENPILVAFCMKPDAGALQLPVLRLLDDGEDDDDDDDESVSTRGRRTDMFSNLLPHGGSAVGDEARLDLVPNPSSMSSRAADAAEVEDVHPQQEQGIDQANNNHAGVYLEQAPTDERYTAPSYSDLGVSVKHRAQEPPSSLILQQQYHGRNDLPPTPAERRRLAAGSPTSEDYVSDSEEEDDDNGGDDQSQNDSSPRSGTIDNKEQGAHDEVDDDDDDESPVFLDDSEGGSSYEQVDKGEVSPSAETMNKSIKNAMAAPTSTIMTAGTISRPQATVGMMPWEPGAYSSASAMPSPMVSQKAPMTSITAASVATSTALVKASSALDKAALASRRHPVLEEIDDYQALRESYEKEDTPHATKPAEGRKKSSDPETLTDLHALQTTRNDAVGNILHSAEGPCIPTPSPQPLQIEMPMQLGLRQVDSPNECLSTTSTEILARQQLLAELREASNLMTDSVNPETAKFWRDHVLDLQARLRAMHGESGSVITNNNSQISPRFSADILENNRRLLSEYQHREQYVPPSPISSVPSTESHRGAPQQKHEATVANGSTQPATAPSMPDLNHSRSAGDLSRDSLSHADYEAPMVDVVAPADLPGGYHFEAEIEGKRFLATVPPGGVQQGETFTCYMRELDSVAIDIPVGYWKDGLYDCCKYGCGHSVVWNAIFLPLITLGQIQTRINLDFLGRPAVGEASLSNRSMMLIVIGFWIFMNIVIFGGYNLKWSRGIELSIADMIAFGMVNIAMIAYVVFVTQSTRSSLREKFLIREQRCYDLEDLCCATWCLPCTVCQMARHTANYDDYEAVCCSKTGLPDGVRVNQTPLKEDSTYVV